MPLEGIKHIAKDQQELAKKLGLKLEATRMAMPVMAVDRVERPERPIPSRKLRRT